MEAEKLKTVYCEAWALLDRILTSNLDDYQVIRDQVNSKDPVFRGEVAAEARTIWRKLQNIFEPETCHE